MPNRLLELVIPLDRRLEKLLADLDTLFREKGIVYLLCGAMAREVLLHHGAGCLCGRLTNDVDFGVIVADWQAFLDIKAALIATEHFSIDTRDAQRVYWHDHLAGETVQVDLVPFGGVASIEGTISWPPDHHMVMSVLGYDFALVDANHFCLNKTQTIPVASPCGLMVMKCVAWLDSGDERKGRDAVDCIALLRHHHETLSPDTLYDAYPAMSETGFDPEKAGAWIMGRMIAERVSDPRLLQVVGNVLDEENGERFLNHAVKGQLPGNREVEYRTIEGLLNAFEKGYRSIARSSRLE